MSTVKTGGKVEMKNRLKNNGHDDPIVSNPDVNEAEDLKNAPVERGIKIIRYTIEGLTSLMYHGQYAYNPELPEEVLKGRVKDIKSWYEHDPKACSAWEAEQALYRDKDTNICIPSRCLWKACLKAASTFKVKKGTMATPFAQAVQIEEDNILLVRKDGKKGDYKPFKDISRIDSQLVRVPPKTGALIMRSRPIIEIPWAAQFHIALDTTLYNDLKVIQGVVQEAGVRFGLLDGRPELRWGKHGKFTVLSAVEL